MDSSGSGSNDAGEANKILPPLVLEILEKRWGPLGTRDNPSPTYPEALQRRTQAGTNVSRRNALPREPGSFGAVGDPPLDSTEDKDPEVADDRSEDGHTAEPTGLMPVDESNIQDTQEVIIRWLDEHGVTPEGRGAQLEIGEVLLRWLHKHGMTEEGGAQSSAGAEVEDGGARLSPDVEKEKAILRWLKGHRPTEEGDAQLSPDVEKEVILDWLNELRVTEEGDAELSADLEMGEDLPLLEEGKENKPEEGPTQLPEDEGHEEPPQKLEDIDTNKPEPVAPADPPTTSTPATRAMKLAANAVNEAPHSFSPAQKRPYNLWASKTSAIKASMVEMYGKPPLKPDFTKKRPCPPLPGVATGGAAGGENTKPAAG